MYIPLLLALAGAVSAVSCDSNNKCPKDKPCCSQYGECGIGAYCLAGCDPISSFDLQACVPQPVCKNLKTTFNNLDLLASVSTYLGNASEYDWTYDGTPLVYDNDMLLTMPNNSVGTVISSTHYMWYGNVKATMKTSHDQGVVTAFILFSGVKDEIDFEFVGADLETAQTNYFFQGVLNYTNSMNISTTDTFSNFHTYELDWTEDRIEWRLDGQTYRTLNKADTYNATDDTYMYPQTPARVQLSIWPGGLSTNAPGTIEWAGGEINWNSQDMQEYGYYYATLSDVEITCYGPPSGTKSNGTTSYIYLSDSGLQEDVMITDLNTILGSWNATGDDMKEDLLSQSNAETTGDNIATARTTATGFVQDTDSNPSSSSSHSFAAKNTLSSYALIAAILAPLVIFVI
ncbi:glycoside hydrolase family 16 protein [Tortispora caseinolytica NRRL Y-17796]|uniref:Crh-like protein n=1 Tax=Tortispora caseinolytica NRRL Y-17796 TaxID=767744 RepID=A0A1E4TB37_9ASCO|nr:glycoside hydrolase family 16 protein [Tortispora caseinolytica NRRL Y-17796]